MGVNKVAVETTNQYTGSNMSDRQLTADLHYRTAVVKVVSAATLLIRRRRRIGERRSNAGAKPEVVVEAGVFTVPVRQLFLLLRSEGEGDSV